MKKEPAIERNDEFLREYDLSRLKGGVRGKHYQACHCGMNLVLIEPDHANLFPDSESVNRALRVLATPLKWLPNANGAAPGRAECVPHRSDMTTTQPNGARHACEARYSRAPPLT